MPRTVTRPRSALTRVWLRLAALPLLLGTQGALTGLPAQEPPQDRSLRDVAIPVFTQPPFFTLPGPDTLRARLAAFLGSLRAPRDSARLEAVPQSPAEAAELASHHLHLRRRLAVGVEYRGYYIVSDAVEPGAAFSAGSATYAIRRGTPYLLLP